MALFAVVNNTEEYRFIECVMAENIDDVLIYCDNKYGKEAQPIALPLIYDTKGNLVYVEVKDVIKEEYKNK